MAVNEVEMQKVTEKTLFTDEKKAKQDLEDQQGCIRSKHTRNCCYATAAFGGVFLVLGVVVMLAGGNLLRGKIYASMALKDGSDRYEAWLRPPVQPHLEGYAFHITNPNAVLEGKKPILKEVGPFVYKSVTLKDSDDNVQWHGDGTLTYRPRKVYSFVPELSNGNPDETFLTVPNIPFWTGMNKVSKLSGIAKNGGIKTIMGNGLATPFINVSFSGLLWGYEDELPCLALEMPKGCDNKADPFSSGGDDEELFGDDDDMNFGEKADSSAKVEDDLPLAKEAAPDSAEEDDIFEPPGSSKWESLVKPKAEIVNCKCNWGLFRDRNITLREPLRIFTGESDMTLKGVVTKFNGKSTLGWWEKGSTCDKVKGQDSSTLPPGIDKNQVFEIYIPLMCRTIKMEYELDVDHAGIKTYRFIPPMNALGRHDDSNPDFRNPENECYCLEKEGFKCLKSGVMYMEPCKRNDQAPVALSMPHFYQADPEFNERVGGLNPEKEKHQFYMDVVPEFGFPLAIRPRFQLNVVISGDSDVPIIRKVPKNLVLPFLWAQDGFDEPSEVMASKIAYGLAAPEKLPLLGSVVMFVIGALLLLTSLGYFFWLRRTDSRTIKDSSN